MTDGARLFIPLGDLVDFGAELARLQNEKKKLHKEIERAGSKLNNPGFLAKAPAEVVEEEKTKLGKFTAMLEKVDESIAKLSDKQ